MAIDINYSQCCTVFLAICFGLASGRSPPAPTPSPDFDCPNNKDAFYRHPADCSAYYHCTNGLAWTEKCPDGLYFNLQTTQCDWPENVNCHQKNGVTRSPAEREVSIIGPAPHYNCTVDGAFPHETACELYYTCWAGNALSGTCTDNMLFDLRYSGCNYPQLTDCGDRVRPEGVPGTITPPATTTTGTPTTSGNPINTTTPVPDEGYNCTTNGAFPHKIYCEKYYDCYDGIDTFYTCNENMLFDLRYSGCNFPELTACQERIRPEGVPGTITPTEGPTTTKRPGSFICPPQDGLYADPEDCSSFYQCSSGHDYHYTCPRPLLYNPAVFSCDHPINVDCGDRPRP